MKIIKIYEEFRHKKFSLKMENNIDSFLDDFKDISIYNYKELYNRDIIYCFCVKNYESKKEEIFIFLEEIKSACKSINVKFEALKVIIKIKNDSLIGLKSNDETYIILQFFLEDFQEYVYTYRDIIVRCAVKLGFNTVGFLSFSNLT